MKTFVIGDIHGRCAQLHSLLDLLPRDESADTLVFLGDLIDRGRDIPGCVEHVLNLCGENPENVICLRGNHEQMLLDFLDKANLIWMETAPGSDQTFTQYTGAPLRLRTEADFDAARDLIAEKIPAAQIEFFRQLPLYHEDEFALYVHAGLESGKHPSESSPHALLWTRDMEFYKSYHGKPCVFGHTPTPFLPLRGRLGRHGIYVFHSAIGIDTGYNLHSPLSCLSLRLHALSGVRRRPHFDPSHHHADPRDFTGNAAEGLGASSPTVREGFRWERGRPVRHEREARTMLVELSSGKN